MPSVDSCSARWILDGTGGATAESPVLGGGGTGTRPLVDGDGRSGVFGVARSARWPAAVRSAFGSARVAPTGVPHPAPDGGPDAGGASSQAVGAGAVRSTGTPASGAVLASPDRAPYSARTNAWPDRKSTRLNSSHLVISYAVFCLK